MTVIDYGEISESLDKGEIIIKSEFTPKKNIGPASMDLHLGNEFLRFKKKGRLPFGISLSI